MNTVHTAEPLLQLRYRFPVYGVPAPQGSKAFKGMRPGKDGRMIANLQESSKKVKPWREAVKFAAIEQRLRVQAEPLDGPLWLRMVFTLAKPASRPKTRKSYPDTKPDLSKLQRSTEDALTDAGLIKDDARIVEYLRAAKVFPGEDPEALDTPGVMIHVYRLAGGAS